MLSMFQNPKTMRWIAVGVSFLFIPAFLLGIASIWSIIFAITIAYYFRRQLLELDLNIESYESWKQRAWYTRKNLFFIILRCYLIVTLTACANYSFVVYAVSDISVKGADVGFFNFVGDIPFDFKIEELTVYAQLLLINFSFTILLFFALFLFALLPFYRAGKCLFAQQSINYSNAVMLDAGDFIDKYLSSSIFGYAISVLSFAVYLFIWFISKKTIGAYSYAQIDPSLHPLFLIHMWPFCSAFLLNLALAVWSRNGLDSGPNSYDPLKE